MEEKKEKLEYAFTWLTNVITEGKPMFGQIQLANFEGLGKMPQDIASAASAAETSDSGMTGAPHYKPVFFCGVRLVHGVNYVFIAEKTQAVNPPLRKLVIIEVNCFNGKYEMVKSLERELF